MLRKIYSKKERKKKPIKLPRKEKYLKIIPEKKTLEK
jgi:hypothetical protein